MHYKISSLSPDLQKGPTSRAEPSRGTKPRAFWLVDLFKVNVCPCRAHTKNHTSAVPYTISGGGDPGVGLNPTKSTNQKARGFEPLLGSALPLGPFCAAAAHASYAVPGPT